MKHQSFRIQKPWNISTQFSIFSSQHLSDDRSGALDAGQVGAGAVVARSSTLESTGYLGVNAYTGL